MGFRTYQKVIDMTNQSIIESAKKINGDVAKDLIEHGTNVYCREFAQFNSGLRAGLILGNLLISEIDDCVPFYSVMYDYQKPSSNEDYLKLVS